MRCLSLRSCSSSFSWLGGVERYYQIARCFRDEDLRADRQPEFTQVDIEMSFVGIEDVLAMMEDVMREVMHEAGHRLDTPLPRITWHDAMERYGCDRPDTRFGLELVDASDVFSAERVQGVRRCACERRRDQGPQRQGCGRLEPRADRRVSIRPRSTPAPRAWHGSRSRQPARSRAPVAKFFSDDEMAALRAALAVEPGDLVCMVADARTVANEVLGTLRLKLADELGIERTGFASLWVLGFPMFKWDEEGERWDASHNPFMLPYAEHVDTLESDPGGALGYSYDLVMNGYEIGGGTLRIHEPNCRCACSG